MLRILLLCLLFLGIYRFIVRFVLPVMKITSTVRGQMRNMQQNQAPAGPAPASSSKVKKGDYIDYEEIKP